jgi:hypothetical protein
LNINRIVDLAQAPGLAGPLSKLGFTDTTAMLEGFLGINPNALFHAGGAAAAPQLQLRARLPTTRPSIFPTWLRPKERILEFTNNPALRVRLIDILEATPDGQTNTFMASTDIDTSGGQVSVTLIGSLIEPWEQPFGIHWLTLNEATVSLTLSDSGPAEVALIGGFTAGNQTITTEFTLTETGTNHSASFVATIDGISLGDVLDLLTDLTGAAPFGGNLPDDALVLSNVRFAFDSSDAQSVTISATSTILGTVQTDVLFSFVQPESGQPLLILGLHVHDFKLSALYSGINGTLTTYNATMGKFPKDLKELVVRFKAMVKERRPGEEGGASVDDKLFTEEHREGIKDLFTKAGVRENADGMTRDAKSLRQTGISLRLELGPNPDYRDIAKWARTSPAMIASFYDQTHPRQSVERIVGFRKKE